MGIRGGCTEWSKREKIAIWLIVVVPIIAVMVFAILTGAQPQ